MICLDRQNRVIGWYKVAMGGTTGIVIDNKIIFQVAFNCDAKRMIIAHNHPSGTLKPSPEDIKTTNRIKQGADIFDIDLLDHLILTSEGYYSFADNNFL